MKKPDGSTTIGRIDCYFATRFVCETKQGVDAAQSAADPLLEKPAVRRAGHGTRGTAAFDRALERAFHQGRDYITWLPAAEGRPPFLMIIDVGFSIDLYAEFTGTGGHYERFPDPTNHRILLKDLHRPEIRDRLRLVWLDPHALDPSKIAAGHPRYRGPARPARQFARSRRPRPDADRPVSPALSLHHVRRRHGAAAQGRLPSLLDKLKDNPRGFPTLAFPACGRKWPPAPVYSTLLFQEIAHFNGGLFEESTALPLSDAQLAMLRDAAATDWAMSSRRFSARCSPARSTPASATSSGPNTRRAPTSNVSCARSSSIRCAGNGKISAPPPPPAPRRPRPCSTGRRPRPVEAKANSPPGPPPPRTPEPSPTSPRRSAKRKDLHALAPRHRFPPRLCQLKVLDPACGTANFLYVTWNSSSASKPKCSNLFEALGGQPKLEMHHHQVRPDHFLGLEINQQAAAIAQLVLWIGYFQWQQKTTGKADTNDRPLLPKDNSTIECQDAVLAYDEP
jgi:hypothetical protein